MTQVQSTIPAWIKDAAAEAVHQACSAFTAPPGWGADIADIRAEAAQSILKHYHSLLQAKLVAIVEQPNCEGEWYEEQPDGTWQSRLVTWEEHYDNLARKYYRVWVVLKHGAYGLKTRPVPGRWYREQNTQELLESLAAGAKP